VDQLEKDMLSLSMSTAEKAEKVNEVGELLKSLREDKAVQAKKKKVAKLLMSLSKDEEAKRKPFNERTRDPSHTMIMLWDLPEGWNIESLLQFLMQSEFHDKCDVVHVPENFDPEEGERLQFGYAWVRLISHADAVGFGSFIQRDETTGMRAGWVTNPLHHFAESSRDWALEWIRRHPFERGPWVRQ